MNRFSLALSCLLAALLCGPAGAGDGRRQLLFERPGHADMRLFVTEPGGLNAATPLVFVMHGVQRNADEYRDQWHDLAMEKGFLLVVPEFSASAYPGSRAYNFGNVFDEQGRQQPRAEWSFAVIEPLFDMLVERYGLDAERYAMYGHSAGAQFVHRFLLHTPEARASSIVSANAGSYTMPDFNVDYPYGLRGSAISPEALKGVFQLPVTILLGDRDIDPNHRSLPDAPAAMLQGPHRLARGFGFFEAGRRTAAELEVPFNWHIATVRGVAHDNAGMAAAAAQLLLD